MGQSLARREVYVLGLDYRVRDVISVQDAVNDLLEGKMSAFEVHPHKRIRSAGGTVDMAWPTIVRLNYWRTPPPEQVMDLNAKANSRDILKRDGYTCCYCGDKASTVDHIKPESQCKKDGDVHNGWTWGNLVAACKTCNQFKGSKSLAEAGMKLRWKPYSRGGNFVGIQKKVWKILEEGGGYIPEEVALNRKVI